MHLLARKLGIGGHMTDCGAYSTTSIVTGFIQLRTVPANMRIPDERD